MMNNRQGGEALINFISSRFKNGGSVASKPVAKFSNGEDVEVDDDYGTFGADELGASVSETAASEDIGAISGDRGPDDSEDIDEDLGTFPEEAITGGPPPDDTGDGRSYFEKADVNQLQSAVEALSAVRNPSAVQTAMLSQARGELKSREARRTGVDTPTKVTEAAVQNIEPIDFLASGMGDPAQDFAPGRTTAPSQVSLGAAGTFDPRISAGIMSDSPQQFDLEQMQLANEIFAKDRQPTSVFPEGRDPQKGAAVVLDRPMQTDRDGYFGSREYEIAPPSGGIAGAINYTDKEIADQQAADAAMSMAAEVEPEFQQARTPDELDEIQDFEDMAAAQQAATVGLQDKKAGLAALGAFAGSPIAAAAPFARDIFKTLTQPDVKAGELLAGKGLGRNQTAQEVVNEKGERIGVVVSDPSGVVSITPTSIEAAFDPALRDAYSKMNERRQDEREARDQGGDEPITAEQVAVEEEETAPEKPPTIDIVPFRPEDFYYFNPQSRYPYGLTSLMNMRTS